MTKPLPLIVGPSGIGKSYASVVYSNIFDWDRVGYSPNDPGKSWFIPLEIFDMDVLKDFIIIGNSSNVPECVDAALSVHRPVIICKLPPSDLTFKVPAALKAENLIRKSKTIRTMRPGTIKDEAWFRSVAAGFYSVVQRLERVYEGNPRVTIYTPNDSGNIVVQLLMQLGFASKQLEAAVTYTKNA
jgi:hypothetical protein